MKIQIFFPIFFLVGFGNMYNKKGQTPINMTLSSVPVTTAAVKNATLFHILSVCM